MVERKIVGSKSRLVFTLILNGPLMGETAQVLILPTDDGSSLFNSAQNRRKNSPSIRHQSVRHTRLPPEWISPPCHCSCAFLMRSSASRVSPFGRAEHLTEAGHLYSET